MRSEIRAGTSRGQPARAFFRAEDLLCIAHQVDGAGQLLPVDDNLDPVAIHELADGASGERFGRDVADAGAGGDAAETGVGEQGYVLAGREPLEGGGELRDLLH